MSAARPRLAVSVDYSGRVHEVRALAEGEAANVVETEYVPVEQLRGGVEVVAAAEALIAAWDSWNGLGGKGHAAVVDGLDTLRHALGGQ